MTEKIKIHILHCGSTLVDESTIFMPEKKPLNPFAILGLFRSPKHRLKIPVTAYLIEHPKGKILVDTGFHKRVRSRPIKELTWLHYLINKPLQKPGQAIDEVLASRGVKPSDLDYVVLSHLHTDHASGLKLVKQARTILVSEDELAFASKDKIKYVHHMWKGVDLKTFKLNPSKYGPVGRAFDLFGDQSLVLVNLPGHTPGHVAVLIQNNGKFLLLTGDCGYAYKSWEQMILPGIMSDRGETIRSFEWLQKMSRKQNCVGCLANHEIDLKSMVIEV